MKRAGMKDLPTGVGKASYGVFVGDWVTPYHLGNELNAVTAP
jgi:hypothetical protein